MAKTSVAIERKMQNKRNRQSLGYSIFYGVLLAGITAGAVFFLTASAGSLPVAVPRFLYDSIPGILYTYNAVALVLMWLTAFLFPRPYYIKALRDNSWNMLYKFGVRPGRLAGARIRGNILSQLVTYGFGFALAAAFAYLLSSDRAVDIMLIGYLALVGVFSILIMLMPVVAMGAMSRGKFVLRLGILLVGGILAYLLYFNAYHVCAELADIAASTQKLISLSPTGLVLVAALFCILFPIITTVAVSSRVRQYNVEDQDEEDLVDLGITGNMLVLTRGRSRYNVAISGPDINGVDTALHIPPLRDDEPDAYYEASVDMPESGEAQSGQKKKKRGKKSRRDEDDAYDPNE